MLNIAIFENKIEHAKQLHKHLDNFKKKSAESINVKEFHDIDDFFAYLVNPVDIVFVNVEVKSTDNKTVVQKIRRRGSDIIIISMSSSIQYAVCGYEERTFDHFVHPVSYLNFSICLTKAIAQAKAKGEKEVHKKIIYDDFGRIDLKNVYCVESRGRDTIYYYPKDKVIVPGTAKRVEYILSEEDFCRISRWHFVNLAFVENYQKTFVVVKGQIFDISRYYSKKFEEALLNYRR